MNSKPLNTEPYKGVRDFYPPEQFLQEYIFQTWTTVCKSYGYESYNASVLEPADLYRAKSGQELVGEQAYIFKDKGDREVMLRPEMTPTLARLVAAQRRNLPLPIRWYSIPNLYRYERPQRGRVREFWQLNVDILGNPDTSADVEIIQIAVATMTAFGFNQTDYTVRLNHRKLLNYILTFIFDLNEAQVKEASGVLDKKRKLEVSEYEKLISTVIAKEKVSLFLTLFNSKNLEEFNSHLKDHTNLPGIEDIHRIIESLEHVGITNVVFDQTLVRGLDYYTGPVFELFDNNPENQRAICGGGRYDDLVTIFGAEPISAVGFGLGDTVMADMLQTYKKVPEYVHPAEVVVSSLDRSCDDYAREVCQYLREEGVSNIVDMSDRKIGDRISNAEKRGIPYIIMIGEEERNSGLISIRNIQSKEMNKVALTDILEYIV